MNRRQLQHRLRSVRPPRPRLIIDAATLPQRAPFVSIGVGESIASALARLDRAFPARTLLVIDQRDRGAPEAEVSHAVAATLTGSSTLTIGLPDGLNPTMTRRWTTLATSAGANAIALGQSGWNRVVFGDRSLILIDADLPVEFYADVTLVALSAPSGDGSLGIWTTYAHPNTALRARFSPNAPIELSSAVDASYLILGMFNTRWLAAYTNSAIAAELLARGIERYAEHLRGSESRGPWEDIGIQHLVDLGMADQMNDLVVQARLADQVDAARIRRLVEPLGWRLDVHINDTGGPRNEE